MKVLVIDVGGTNVKLLASGQSEPRKVPSGPDLTAARMVKDVREATEGWKYDAVTIGYPGVVLNGAIQREPVNLGEGWVGYNFAKAFGKPVKLINDAALQALGSYQGGRMLFLGLGTGLGTSLVLDGFLVPMEGGHLPYRKQRSFEDYVGEKGMRRLGRKKWQECVEEVVAILRACFMVDDVVLGGGNSRKLDPVPSGTRLGDNRNAFVGGFRLWEDGKRGKGK